MLKYAVTFMLISATASFACDKTVHVLKNGESYQAKCFDMSALPPSKTYAPLRLQEEPIPQSAVLKPVKMPDRTRQSSVQ